MRHSNVGQSTTASCTECMIWPCRIVLWPAFHRRGPSLASGQSESVRILWRLFLRVLRFCPVNIISTMIRTNTSFIYHGPSTRRIMLAMTTHYVKELSLTIRCSPFGKSNSYCFGAICVSKYLRVGAGCGREGTLWSHCFIYLCRKIGQHHLASTITLSGLMS